MASCPNCDKEMFPFGVKNERSRWVCPSCGTVVTLDHSTQMIIIGSFKELGIKVIDYKDVVEDGAITQELNTLGRSGEDKE